MPVQPFGKADPYYDALRVMSNQNIQGAALGDTGGVGGALENKIYLWPADGTTITTYDPDQAGLLAALAAAVNGDTVWLPSMTIALTVPVSVRTGVCLRGMDWNAELSFSGFDNVALLVDSGAIAYNFSLRFVATGATAIGVQAQGDDAIIDHLHIVVSGASTSNIGIGSTAPQAGELWFATENDVVWSNNIVFSGSGTINWNKMPSYAQTGLLSKFVILQDGTGLFIEQGDPLNGNLHTIYECTNLAAVRANPTTIPTWSRILGANDVVSTNVGNLIVSNNVLMDRYGSKLIISFLASVINTYKVYGEYEAGVWTFTATTPTGNWVEFGPDAQIIASFASAVEQGLDLVSKGGTHLGDTAVQTPTGGISRAWRSTINSDYYAVRFYSNTPPWNETPSRYYAFKFNASGNPANNIGVVAGTNSSQQIRGAINGLSLLIVNSQDGKFYLSEDRTTLTNPATWLYGLVEESSLAGGSNLVWMPFAQSNGASIIQTSSDRGANWTTRTNDFWSAIQIANSFVMLNMYTVF